MIDLQNQGSSGKLDCGSALVGERRPTDEMGVASDGLLGSGAARRGALERNSQLDVEPRERQQGAYSPQGSRIAPSLR